jgi:hypothetical protein
MSEAGFIVIVFAVAAALLALALTVWLTMLALTGASILFRAASEVGCLMVIVLIVAVILFFPATLLLFIVVGLLARSAARD